MMQTAVACSRWALVLVLAMLAAMNAQAARLALVIGNKDYAVGALRNPLNDAEDMARVLGQELGFGVTLVRNLKRDDIGRVVEGFANRIRPGDDVLVFYAGHGLQVKGVNYLPAVDARIQVEGDVALNSLNLNELLLRLDEARAGVRLLLVDACRDNPYSRGFRSNARGLARVEGAPSGTLMHFATRPGGVADDGPGRNGLYTTELLKHLRTPGLAVELMLKRVASAVRQASGGSQQPWVEGSLDGEFYFAAGRVPEPAVVVERLPAPAPAHAPTPASGPGPVAGQVRKDCSDCPDMVVVGGGEFTMGSPANEAGRAADEGPQRVVRVATFMLGRTEVTVAQYRQCVQAGGCAVPEWDEAGSKYNARSGTDDHYRKLGAALPAGDHPVVGVSWNDAQRYVRWMSRRTGQSYRLPSEAEWEYAARAGSRGRYSFGDNEASLGEYAWFSDNSAGHPHAVGTRQANGWGLFDLHGNVWEWLQDCYVDNYNAAPRNGGAVDSSSCSQRVLRGGSWYNGPQRLRSAYRIGDTPDGRSNYAGFRVARTF